MDMSFTERRFGCFYNNTMSSCGRMEYIGGGKRKKIDEV